MKRKTVLLWTLSLVMAPFLALTLAGQDPQEEASEELTEEELQAMADEHVNMIIEQWAGSSGQAKRDHGPHATPFSRGRKRTIKPRKPKIPPHLAGRQWHYESAVT